MLSSLIRMIRVPGFTIGGCWVEVNSSLIYIDTDFRFSGKYIILCILKGKLPFKMHKIIYFQKMKN